MGNVMLISNDRFIIESNKRMVFPHVKKITSVQCFYTVGDALESGTNPDVILIEYRLGSGRYGPDYIPALRERFPNSKIVGYTVDESSEYAFDAYKADGFIPKIQPLPILVEDIGSYFEESS